MGGVEWNTATFMKKQFLAVILLGAVTAAHSQAQFDVQATLDAGRAHDAASQASDAASQASYAASQAHEAQAAVAQLKDGQERLARAQALTALDARAQNINAERGRIDLAFADLVKWVLSERQRIGHLDAETGKLVIPAEAGEALDREWKKELEILQAADNRLEAEIAEAQRENAKVMAESAAALQNDRR
jgi:hypothetical protein